MIRFTAAACLALVALTACSGDDGEDIVVATPFAISISTTRFTEPLQQAQAHCQQFGRNAVSRGGVQLGEPAWKTMWGFDCVDP